MRGSCNFNHVLRALTTSEESVRQLWVGLDNGLLVVFDVETGWALRVTVGTAAHSRESCQLKTLARHLADTCGHDFFWSEWPMHSGTSLTEGELEWPYVWQRLSHDHTVPQAQ